MINDQPTLEELEKALKSLDNHKQANDDGLVCEMFKYGKSELSKRKLLHIFILAWNTGQLPSLMCRATLIPSLGKETIMYVATTEALQF